MARLNKAISSELEVHEGALAHLGNARVLLGLVEIRVSNALSNGGMIDLLRPALEDLSQIDRHIRTAQRAITHARIDR